VLFYTLILVTFSPYLKHGLGIHFHVIPAKSGKNHKNTTNTSKSKSAVSFINQANINNTIQNTI
jgi:hypothetical protein